MRVIYKRTAVKDMEATRDYIAGRLKNPKAAKKLVTALLKAISLLADNPYMGMIPRHTVLRNKNYRMLIINKNIILYRVFDDEKEVRIYNIFSQRQDYLQLLQGL